MAMFLYIYYDLGTVGQTQARSQRGAWGTPLEFLVPWKIIWMKINVFSRLNVVFFVTEPLEQALGSAQDHIPTTARDEKGRYFS